MSDHEVELFVVSGGPGSGKTTLIEALKDAGYHTYPEVGRQIIQEQNLVSGEAVPWKNPRLYAEIMLSWEMRSYHLASNRKRVAFFDRGIPDIIGYLHLLELPVPDHLMSAAKMFPYGKRVFLCPPWPEIFEQDEERKQTFDIAERTYEAIARTYAGLGYDLETVPITTVFKRVRFVLDMSNETAGLGN